MAGYLPSELPGGEAVTLGSNDLLTVQKAGESVLKRIKWSTLQALQIPGRLGAVCDSSLTDYNNAVENGWYILPATNSGATNGPGSGAFPLLGSTTSPYYVWVMASGNYVQQHAYAQQGGGVPQASALQAYSRVRYNGVWQSWQGIAPSLKEQGMNWAGPRLLGPNNLIQGILKQRNGDTDEVVKTWYFMDNVLGAFDAGSAVYTLPIPFDTQIRNVLVNTTEPGSTVIFVYATINSTSQITVTAKDIDGNAYSGTLRVTLFAMGY
jgi:hypothetical protein